MAYAVTRDVRRDFTARTATSDAGVATICHVTAWRGSATITVPQAGGELTARKVSRKDNSDISTFAIYCEWVHFHGVPIFVVFMEGLIHNFQFSQNDNFLYDLWKKILSPRVFIPTNWWFLLNAWKLVSMKKIKPSIAFWLTIHILAFCVVQLIFQIYVL